MSKHVPNKPWCICRLGESEDKRIIARYANLQDAEDDLRSLIKFVKDNGQYVIADILEPDKKTSEPDTKNR